jgi:phosphocarrier protein
MTIDSKNNIEAKIDLIPSEFRAMLDRKYFMAKELGRDVTIEEAIDDFRAKYEAAWLKEKTRRDNLAENDEISKYVWISSEKAGKDLRGEAVEKWMKEHAPIWREERESLVKNNFLERKVTIQNTLGLHLRPSATLVAIAKKYDCDLYVHKQGMDNYNFTIKKKPYTNVCSILMHPIMNLAALCAAKGDELDFIAYGKQAKEALDEIESIVNQKFGEEE